MLPPTLPLPEFGSKALFPTLTARAYLSHAAVAPVALPVHQATVAVLDDYARSGVGSVLRWRQQREQLRGQLAELLGAAPSELAVTRGTTEGIVDIALSIPWRASDRLVLLAGEFPTNVTPWLAAARHHALAVEFLDAEAFRTDAGLDALKQVLRKGVRLVALSAVQFRTGLRLPLGDIGVLCHEYGAELFVDAIQATGIVPLDVKAARIDYLSSGGHKWLLGVEGSGFLFVDEARRASLQPRTIGWTSHEGAEDFLFRGSGYLNYEQPLKPTAAVFEGGSGSVLGAAALEAGLSMIRHLGPQAIWGHIQGYLDALEPRLLALGFTSLRCPEPERRSGSLSVNPPPGVDAVSLHRSLAQAGISCSLPDGLLRFSPHFSNCPSEVDWVAHEVKRLLRTAHTPRTL